ncbi:unnamed protein product [Callosobruchus maculatus]|uniref:THAP4-like heme-binding domain-containing protein n=1 Tax=Callosobruchus maculatus TaxID=64391 RepID=A0A653CEE7_CALMS|nr:unnamed protein product [Callosobruchus maculatus]
MRPGQIHESLNPLKWLIGTWKSVSAKGAYPTISPFTYCEEISFESIGQPMLNYTSKSWHPEKGNPMHLESGYLRIFPGSKISFMVAHNFGLTTLEEGTVQGNTVQLKSKQISRMTHAKEPAVTEVQRDYKLNENGQLEMVMCMATSKTPMTEHLRVIYEKFVQ